MATYLLVSGIAVSTVGKETKHCVPDVVVSYTMYTCTHPDEHTGSFMRGGIMYHAKHCPSGMAP